jgi:hypothetical protein
MEESEKVVRNASVITAIKSLLPKFSSRAIRRNFIQKYSTCVKAPKTVLRQMFYDLTGYEYSTDSSAQKERDERTIEVLLGADDPEILKDLDNRCHNGKQGTRFTEFYDQVQKYFDEQVLPVNERRHTSELYLPLAISVEDLRSEVAKRLPEGTPIPCCETLRLQFHPANSYRKCADRFTGRFDVQFKVQSRMSHMNHIDARYVATLYRYLKEFVVLYKSTCKLFFLDDKSIVPVGEPGVPISTGVRGHNKVLVPMDTNLTACDHDFHVSGLVPSVALACETPSAPEESFFNGQVFVTVKDKVFAPSTPLRHATELVDIIRENFAEDHVALTQPILAIFTDGGPDHRPTYETVKVSLAVLFLQLDLDMPIAVRTAPHNSWMNPAERVMSILNLALQHVSLERSKMSDEQERAMKTKGSMTAVRNYAKNREAFKTEYRESMKSVVDIVSGRFQRMKIKDVPIKTCNAAQDDEIEDMLTPLSTLTNTKLTSKECSGDLKKHKELQKFIANHSKSTHYTFQLLKCKDDACGYCSFMPHRLPDDVFQGLSYIPEPTPNAEMKIHTSHLMR